MERLVIKGSVSRDGEGWEAEERVSCGWQWPGFKAIAN